MKNRGEAPFIHLQAGWLKMKIKYKTLKFWAAARSGRSRRGAWLPDRERG
jgi:hypothetical protein